MLKEGNGCVVYGRSNVMSEVEWMEIFAGNLKSILEEQNMSQAELAEAACLSESAISNYINCKKMPSIRSILNISYATDVLVDELIDFGGPLY